MIQTKCLRFCRLDSSAWTLSSSIAAATRRFWLATIDAVIVGAHLDTTSGLRPVAGLVISMSAWSRSSRTMPCARLAAATICSRLAKFRSLKRAMRAFERLICRFAVVRDRRHLRSGRGIGSVERKVGRASFAGPLAGTLEQQIGGLVDGSGIGSGGAIHARVVQNIAGHCQSEQREQRNSGDQEIANVQDSRSLSGRMHGRVAFMLEILNANDKDAEIAKRGRGINPRRS